MRKAHCLFIIVLLQFIYSSVACPWTVAEGKKWSVASTWPSGVVPRSGTVTIPSGLTVIYDISTSGSRFTGIVVPANTKLIFDGTKDIVLETNYVDVKVGGAFLIGSTSCPFTKNVNITLFGPKDTSTSISGMGNKAIINAGRLEFFGVPPSPTWTNVAATVNVNATSFTVKDTLSNWKVGGEIFLASTDYYQELSEVFTIKAINGKTITVDRPVKYLHYGTNNQFAEVGYLTRNILVQGDPSSDDSKFGGHAINYGTAATTTVMIRGVEFNRMGQAGIVGRYPFHFHVMGDNIGKGYYVNESSFHHSYQRCLTVHGTSGVAVKNNVGFNVSGHCYFLEEGSETWNTYEHNLGAWVNPGTTIPTDNKPSVFWITNPNNTFVRNAAVGGTFGFWYSLPVKPLALTSHMTWIYPRYTPLQKFEDNVAHSSSSNGVHCDGGPKANGEEENFSYTPLVPPYTATTQSYNTDHIRAVFKNTNAYKNRQYGMWMKGGYLTVENALLQDNGIGVNTPGAGNIVQNTVIVGETANIGTPGFTRYYDDKGRSRPRLWDVGYKIHGWEGYDNTGAQFARNVTFIDFVSNSVRHAGAVSALQSGPFILPPTDILSEVKLRNSNEFVMNAGYSGAGFRDGPNHVVIHDADGSLTGSYGSYIVTNNSILTFAGNCTKKPQWTDFFHCQPTADGYSHIAVLNKDAANTDFKDALSQTIRGTFIPFGRSTIRNGVTAGNPNSQTRTSYTANVFSRKGYVLEFPHPTPPVLQFNLRYASTGEWVVLALTYPSSTTFTITRGYSKTPVTPVTSLGALTKTTYYYDATTSYLYLMYFEDNGRIENSAGFPQYGYGDGYLDISASCGKTCSVSGTRPIPANFVHGEDNYRANLQGCTAGTSSAYQGQAHVQYNPKTKRVTYMIYHNIPRATYARITGLSGTYFEFPVAQSPIRGGFSVSWTKFNELWNGNWTITVGSANAAHKIAGKFGCVGTCSIPPKISPNDGCTSVSKEVYMYKDSINTTAGWADWSWGSNRTLNYAADKKCGTAAVLVNYNNYGALSLHVGTGNCVPGSCTQSWQVPYLSLAPFAFLQFLVKSPSGPLTVPFVVRITDHADRLIGERAVAFGYINNWAIENSWTRVKIPLADFGVKSTDLAGLFSFVLTGNVPAGGLTLLFDDIKLVPTYADTNTRSPIGAVKPFSTNC